MKHKIILIVTGILLFSACVFSSKLFKSNELSLDEKEKTKQIVRENTLSMMIEQTAGAGNYKMETRISWPTDGYKFNEILSKCENGGILGWDSEKGVVTMTGNMSDKCYVYFDKVPPNDVSDVCSGGETLSGCVITLSQESSPSYTNIYYHNSSLTNGAGDNSYRYAGASSTVNNYVCFGSDTETCPTDNLYRIIGVFGDQVKLIKSTSIGSMVWVYDNINIWSTSSLNSYLNGTYLVTFSETWKAKIATTTWKVGGNTLANIRDAVPKTAYANEITNSASSTTYSSKIGLMYISDYGFAASSTAWSTTLYSYNSYTSVNWMYLGSTEWTISRRSDNSSEVFYVSWGQVGNEETFYTFEVRPVFYLASSATYSSGMGTSDNPYRLG